MSGGIPVDRMSRCDALFERRFRRMIAFAESVTSGCQTLTGAFPSTHRQWRLRVVTDAKIRCDGGLSTRFRRRVRGPKRIAVIFDRTLLAGSLVYSLWCVRRTKRLSFVLGRMWFRGNPFAHPSRLVSRKIEGITRLS
jgi:hypothetical protein